MDRNFQIANFVSDPASIGRYGGSIVYGAQSYRSIAPAALPVIPEWSPFINDIIDAHRDGFFMSYQAQFKF
ncbi:hypothetical protein [Olivibacter sp. EAT-5]|jgi:hypothetical protein|uniref:hypothetical protein n=1 Tax=Olivibacter sp. EAT-5 TaxID=3376061 RepID=UPI00384E3528